MQKLDKVKGLVKWVKPEMFGFTQRDGLILEAYEVIDENTIHVAFKNLGAFCFLVNDTELNGKVFNNSAEFIAELDK